MKIPGLLKKAGRKLMEEAAGKIEEIMEREELVTLRFYTCPESVKENIEIPEELQRYCTEDTIALPKGMNPHGSSLVKEETVSLPNILPEDTGSTFSFLMALDDSSTEHPSVYASYGPSVLAIARQKEREILLVHLPGKVFTGIRTFEKDLEERYHIPVDYYVITRSDTFADLIDALGGIEVDGQKLDGKKALTYTEHDEKHLLLPAFLDELTSFTGLFKLLGFSSKLRKTIASDIPKEKIASILQNELETEKEWEIRSLSGEDTEMIERFYR